MGNVFIAGCVSIRNCHQQRTLYHPGGLARSGLFGINIRFAVTFPAGTRIECNDYRDIEIRNEERNNDMGNVQVYKRSGSRGCFFWALLLVALPLSAIICLATAASGGLALGLFSSSQEVKTATYNEPLGNTDSAEIELGIGVAKLIIGAAGNSGELFTADVSYVGEINYDVTGSQQKSVSLRQHGDTSTPGSWRVFGINLDFDFFNIFDRSDDLTWRIGLAPDIPLELDVSGGVGEMDLDLTDLQLDDLMVAVGVGGVNLRLPEPQESYRVVINGGVGSTEITLPRNVAVRVETTVGVGGINTPGFLNRVSGEQEFVGAGGVWETEGFDQADTSIVITFDGGVGSLTIR
jgi:hypothetical protein